MSINNVVKSKEKKTSELWSLTARQFGKIRFCSYVAGAGCAVGWSFFGKEPLISVAGFVIGCLSDRLAHKKFGQIIDFESENLGRNERYESEAVISWGNAAESLNFVKLAPVFTGPGAALVLAGFHKNNVATALCGVAIAGAGLLMTELGLWQSREHVRAARAILKDGPKALANG